MTFVSAFLRPLRGCLAVAALFASAPFVLSQSAALGTIEGRIQSARTGEFIEGARLTVEGTPLETFTDRDGLFRLTNVPAGAARVTVFYTGLPPQTSPVAVTAGQVAQLDLTLGRTDARPGAGVVQLDEFVVATSREMDAAALAINEQRFSSNIKNVVSRPRNSAMSPRATSRSS